MPETLPVSQVQIPPGFIDLGMGNPPSSLLPLDLIRSATEACLAQGDNAFLQYGNEQGDGYFRAALAEFLAKGYGFPVDPATLFVTTGISNGLDMICTLFTRAGDTIFVEEPSYFLALRIFADHGVRVIPIPTDEDGLVIEALQEKLSEFHPKFLYIVPTFQNPSGHTLSAERRERLVALARQHDFLIAADEVYHFLGYTRRAPAPFGAYIETPNVISLGSFSKILAPGLRLGWLQAHPQTVQRFVTSGLLDSGGGLNPFTSAIVRVVIESGGLAHNIEKLKAAYSPRIKVMDAALRKHLPGAVFTVPQGGYFFWVRLPASLDVEKLRETATRFKVDFRPGVRFSSRGAMKDHIRLSFAFYNPDDIEEGVSRLGKCLQEI